MREVTFTVCDEVGPCGECGRVPEHIYQFSVYGRGILLCGQCLDTFISQVRWMLQIVEPNLKTPAITLKAEQPSDLQCRKCLDMLAAHLTTFYRRR